MTHNSNMIAGIDEAGRGAWAGPVVAATVILKSIDKELVLSLKDSKSIPPKNRRIIYEQMIESEKNGNLAFGIGTASVDEIYQFNILQATLLAMKRSIFHCQKKTHNVFYIWVDGNHLPKFSKSELLKMPSNFLQKSKTIISGDRLIPSISAASIIAKVARDDLMISLDQKYPKYGFAQHKGYGTKQHQLALDSHGICPMHRKSYKPISKLLLNY